MIRGIKGDEMTTVIVIDNKIMNEYKKIYFKLNPKCRKCPDYFNNPIPPSWNFFIAKQRMTQNSIKQKYKQFGVWLAEKYKINNLNLERAKFTYDFYFKDNRRRDIDNYTLTQKLLGDAFTEAKVLLDDNSKILALQFNPFKLDKENPRVEIMIEY